MNLYLDTSTHTRTDTHTNIIVPEHKHAHTNIIEFIYKNLEHYKIFATNMKDFFTTYLLNIFAKFG